MAFLTQRFPTDISRGATGGPEFSTGVVALQSGHEQRNINWAQSRGKWNVSYGVKTKAQLDNLVAFFMAARGRAHAFRFKDWADHMATDQTLGLGNGTGKVFQLIKDYAVGTTSHLRTITRPIHNETVDGVLHRVRVWVGGVETTAFTVDIATGLVTLATAPADGATVKASFAFDVPVRFASDHLPVQLDTLEYGGVNSVELVEVRG